MIPLALIQQAHDAGLSIVPPAQDGSKKPRPLGGPGWKTYQQHPASLTVLQSWYDPLNGLTGIGVVCGKVSGGLEVLDFDTRQGWLDYQELAEHCGVAPLLSRIWAGYGEESPRGAHVLYRCSEIAGNTKLAKNPDGKAFIETRGEGGYIIIAPSNGAVNPHGDYRCVSGDLSGIVTITPTERRDLWELAKSMCLAIRPLNPSEPLQSSRDPANKPGADFNRRASWREVLEPHGWRIVYAKGAATYWRRPDKSTGISATTGYDGTDYLYVFTTSTPLDSERAYTKFGAYGVLNHQGDYRAATAALGRAGYGDAPRPPGESSRPHLQIIANDQPLPDADEAPVWATSAAGDDADIPAECLEIPFGCGPELVRYLMDSSLHPNPVFAVQTARVFLGAVLSRRHVTSQRNYASLYTILIGKTASGKEDAKHQVENLLTTCGLSRMLVGKGYSHPSAIYTALQDEPKHLTLIDEMGLYLREQKNPQSTINLLIREFMELFGRAHGLHHAPRLSALGLSKSDRDSAKNTRTPVVKPGLNLMAMSTPETFWASMSRDHLDSGFLNRFLIVESQALRSVMVDFRAVPVPESVIEWAGWATAKDDPLMYSQQFIYDMEPPIVVWTLTASAKNAMRDFEQRMIDLATEWDLELSGLGNLALRANEISLRLALQNAALEQSPESGIAESHILHAQRYTECHLRRAAMNLQRGMVASAFEGQRNIVLEALRGKGGDGVTEREMSRTAPFTRFTAKERTEILTALESGYLIARLNVRQNQPGKKRIAWVALDPEQTAQYCRAED